MLGKRLRDCRGRRTQEEISNLLGISRARYSHYENEHVQPDNDMLQKMADLYDVSVDYLLGRTADQKQVLKEQSRQLIDMIDLELSDDEILSKMNLYVDGLKVPDNDVRVFINLVRANRIRMKLDDEADGIASTKSKT